MLKYNEKNKIKTSPSNCCIYIVIVGTFFSNTAHSLSLFEHKKCKYLNNNDKKKMDHLDGS